MISTTGKKLVNLQGLPYMPPNMVNFDPKWLRTVGEFLPTPPQKILHSETIPVLPHGHYIADIRQTWARVM